MWGDVGRCGEICCVFHTAGSKRWWRAGMATRRARGSYMLKPCQAASTCGRRATCHQGKYVGRVWTETIHVDEARRDTGRHRAIQGDIGRYWEICGYSRVLSWGDMGRYGELEHLHCVPYGIRCPSSYPVTSTECTAEPSLITPLRQSDSARGARGGVGALPQLLDRVALAAAHGARGTRIPRLMRARTHFTRAVAVRRVRSTLSRVLEYVFKAWSEGVLF